MKERYVIGLEVVGAGLMFGSLIYELGVLATAVLGIGLLLVIGAQLVKTR